MVVLNIVPNLTNNMLSNKGCDKGYEIYILLSTRFLTHKEYDLLYDIFFPLTNWIIDIAIKY